MVNSYPMDDKTLTVLEFPKILDRLASYAAFSASADLARALRPTSDLDEARARQSQTTEARRLLDTHADIGVGGATYLRPMAGLALRGGLLDAADLLAVKSTLIAARTIARSFPAPDSRERKADEFPHLSALLGQMQLPVGLIDAISHVLSDHGEIMDSASELLASIRHQLKASHDRLMSKLEHLINDPKAAPMLQEPIITQRNGRYVVPLRAEFKGRIRSIIHDQSASGATLFIEPLSVVDLNNAFREMELAERDEERRLLADLSRQVGDHAAEIERLVQVLAEFDLALMRAKYAQDLRAVEPVLAPFWNLGGDHPGSAIRLVQASHPLLPPDRVVPIDFILDERTFAVVITGPNTGGKTVSLKTVGLLALMAQSGLHIPAQSGSVLSVFEAIYADIGDEQSIEQSLSTFSAHINNIIRILKKANSRSLVILDELGAGTDPGEGSALARAILSHLLRRRVTTLVATHYPELKSYAHTMPGVVNASVEFDLKTLQPTYHLTLGLPGRSNAIAIAERLGLPADIIALARGKVNPAELRSEDLLDEIHHQRDVARKARAAAEKAEREAAEHNADLRRRLDQIEEERRQILEQARRQAEDELAQVQREAEDARKALARARQPIESVRQVENHLEAIQEEVETPVAPVQPSGPTGPLKVGEKVRLRSLGMQGVVTGLSESEAEVQVGALRVRARLSDLQRKGEPDAPSPESAPPSPPPPRPRTAHPSGASPSAPPFQIGSGLELDIRGQRSEDALPTLERYIDSAYLAGLPYVRIIHGKGTGRLRQDVRDMLRASSHVTSFEPGQEREGGDGVTVVHLATD